MPRFQAMAFALIWTMATGLLASAQAEREISSPSEAQSLLKKLTALQEENAGNLKTWQGVYTFERRIHNSKPLTPPAKQTTRFFVDFAAGAAFTDSTHDMNIPGSQRLATRDLHAVRISGAKTLSIRPPTSPRPMSGKSYITINHDPVWLLHPDDYSAAGVLAIPPETFPYEKEVKGARHWGKMFQKENLIRIDFGSEKDADVEVQAYTYDLSQSGLLVRFESNEKSLQAAAIHEYEKIGPAFVPKTITYTDSAPRPDSQRFDLTFTFSDQKVNEEIPAGQFEPSRNSMMEGGAIVQPPGLLPSGPKP